MLPATRPEMKVALSCSEPHVFAVARHLLVNGYATEWGSRLTEKGTLAPILEATGKTPID